MKDIRCWLSTAALVSSLAILAALAGCVAGAKGSEAGAAEDAALRRLETDPWNDPQRVVAEVNGKAISQGEFYRRLLEQFGSRRYLTGLIAQEIVKQEAARRKIVATPEELERAVEASFEEEAQEVGGRENLERQYRELGLGMDEIRKERASRVEDDLVFSKLVMALRVVDDDVLREYYKYTYKNVRYATRHIAYSFRPKPGQSEAEVPRLKLEAQSRAARAADRVRKGAADFATLARAESEDTVTRKRGGDLGAVFDDPRVPEYMRVVFKLGVNEVSDPVENPEGGYHIFQVTAILPSESYADCQEKMRKEILEQPPSAEEKSQALRKLQSEATVNIFPATYRKEAVTTGGAAAVPASSTSVPGGAASPESARATSPLKG